MPPPAEMQAGDTLRQLGPGEETLIAGLLDMFGRAFKDEASYGANRPGADYMRRLLARDHFIALVAIRDGQVVGGLAAYELPKFEQARSETYIYDLAVADGHRWRGIAEALIRASQHEAASRGAWMIFVQADPGDDPAIALYAKLGTR